jgi:hypothetical protein
MPLSKGRTNNPKGRKKGSQNHFSSDMKTYLMDVLESNRERIIQDMEELNPKDRLKFIIDLLPYVLPKLQATTNDTHLSIENLTEQDLDTILSKLT